MATVTVYGTHTGLQLGEAGWGWLEWAGGRWGYGVVGVAAGTSTASTIIRVDFSGGFLSGAMNGGFNG